jgi:hypothetical protein
VTTLEVFGPRKPDVYRLDQIYNPATEDPIPGTDNVVPSIGSLVIDTNNNGNLFWVTAVDATTHASTLEPVEILVTNNQPSITSIVSYGNDIIRVYFDTRSNPISLSVDGFCKIEGGDSATYQLIRYPGTPNEAIISLYYDSNGTFSGNNVPMVPVVNGLSGVNEYQFKDCNIPATLIDGERLLIKVFNIYGAQRASVTVFAKQATIVNEDNGHVPVIESMVVNSSQSQSNGDIYIYAKQDVSSLNLTVTLNYDDGFSQQIAIDNTRCFVYGLQDFVASYIGLQQQILVKYFLATQEAVDPTLLNQSGTHITVVKNLVVVSNELAPGVKISTVPRWSGSTSRYQLFYFIYTTDGTSVINITPYVTLSSGTFSGTLYGVTQNITLSVDLSNVYPSTYSVPTIYQQQCIITLQPISMLQEYIISDSSSSAYTFGVDTPTAHRPQLLFDTTRQQYYIPTALFPTLTNFLTSFFTYASPPFDISTSTSPPIPTHFILRDIASGLSLLSAPIPIANYNAAFSIVTTNSVNYLVSTNVIVEFWQFISGSYLTIFGVPVDIYQGTTPYQGS